MILNNGVVNNWALLPPRRILLPPCFGRWPVIAIAFPLLTWCPLEWAKNSP